jgi:hypothetical protein
MAQVKNPKSANSRAGLVRAVTTPLGFYVLLLLIGEASLRPRFDLVEIKRGSCLGRLLGNDRAFCGRVFRRYRVCLGSA